MCLEEQGSRKMEGCEVGGSPWKENWEIVFDFSQAKWGEFLLPFYKNVLFLA